MIQCKLICEPEREQQSLYVNACMLRTSALKQMTVLS